MDKTEEILELYRQSDFYGRMCLTLRYSDLRQFLEDFERENLADEKDFPAFE